MRRRRILLFVSALSAIAALAGCSKSEEKPPEIIRPVLSMVIEPQTTRTFGFAGSIEPQVSADLAFRLLGRVVSRDVKVGDIVSKGTTIATLDPTALELAVQAAKAELSNAEAQFTNAAASEDRQRQLLAAANTSQAVFDAAQQARQAAEAGVERAKAALAKSQEQLGYARLFSDFDGVVTATGAEVGQTVSAGQTIVTVARSDLREAVVDIPDQLTGDLSVGTPFEVILQSLPINPDPGHAARDRTAGRSLDAQPPRQADAHRSAASLPARLDGDGDTGGEGGADDRAAAVGAAAEEWRRQGLDRR